MRTWKFLFIAGFLLGCNPESKDTDPGDEDDDTNLIPYLQGELSVVFESSNAAAMQDMLPGYHDCSLLNTMSHYSTEVPDGCPNCTVEGQVKSADETDCGWITPGSNTISFGIDLDAEMIHIYDEVDAAWEEFWPVCSVREVEVSATAIQLDCVTYESASFPLQSTSNASFTWPTEAPDPAACAGNFLIDEVDTSGDLDAIADCITISGDLEIKKTDLTNLSAFANLTEIGGDLSILNNNALTNLDGLSKLTSVGDVWLQFNPLTNIAGLSGLTSIGDLGITDSEITTLGALSSLETIGGDLYIAENPALTALELTSVKSVAEELDIEWNPALCQSLVDEFIAGITVGEVGEIHDNKDDC